MPDDLRRRIAREQYRHWRRRTLLAWRVVSRRGWQRLRLGPVFAERLAFWRRAGS